MKIAIFLIVGVVVGVIGSENNEGKEKSYVQFFCKLGYVDVFHIFLAFHDKHHSFLQSFTTPYFCSVS